MVVGGVGGVVHPAAGRRLQSDVSGAFPLQQRHRWTQTQRLRRSLHRAVRWVHNTQHHADDIHPSISAYLGRV